jgi:two-component system nitrogen regulation response regulator GlnG
MLTSFGNQNEKEEKLILVGTIDRKVEEVLEKKLDGLRYNVCYVRKGSEVVLNILKRDVDLLILDMNVSKPLGFDILSIIRKTRPRLPVIVISADCMYQLRRAVVEERVSSQMLKPMETDDITLVSETVNKLLTTQPVQGE